MSAVSRRYAKAIFALAEDEQSLEPTVKVWVAPVVQLLANSRLSEPAGAAAWPCATSRTLPAA